MNKAIATYITSMVIIFALTCAVSANSDCDFASQNELTKITAIQAAIDENNGGWIAGETTVSGFSADEKMALGGARIAALPPGATVVRPASAGMSATRMSATSVSATSVTASAFDWRDNDGENWVTPVKSQGSCGSCWAFSAIGVVESAARIYAKNPDLNIDLSEQHLVSDCCSKAGSCSGGWPDWALDYIRDTGVPDEDCSPYNAKDCGCNPCSGWGDQVLKIDGYVYVQPTKEDFKSALQQYGPMSVVLTAPSDWYYYRTGVYSPTQSRENGVGWANHAVVLVGWDDSDDCWIVKNSWGAGWGENGYARVKYGDLEKYNYAYAVTGVFTDNEPPEAFASATPVRGDAPLTTTFAGTGTDSDGTVESYYWDFGDGESSADQNPKHIYTDRGTYTATLTVTDDDGAIGTDSVVIKVIIDHENQPPEAFASVTPESGEAPLNVVFAGTGNDSDGDIKSYYWDFGDGDSSADQNTTHRYTVPGIYTATLTVTDGCNKSGTDNVTIEVTRPVDGSWVSPVAATASSTHNDKYAPEKAIDGSMDTCWFSERHTALPCWIQFDLGETAIVSKVRTVIFGKDVPITFDVQVSTDGTDWTTVAADFTITEADTYITVPCDPANARYVRLQETALSGAHGQCTEFEVYASI